MILLDTQLILWWCYSPQFLPIKVVKIVAKNQNNIYISELSLLETVLKMRSSKLKFFGLPDDFNTSDFAEMILLNGFQWLPITRGHIFQLEKLDKHSKHKDPHDLLLIAQSRVESMRFLTSDKILKDYGAEYYPRKKQKQN